MRKRFLTWIPAMLTLGAAVVTALGISLVPAAVATTDTEDINVTATVAAEVHVTNGCGGAVTAGANLATTDDDISLGTCVITFGSNNAAGATLAISDANADASNFCVRAALHTDPCNNAGVDNTHFPNTAGGVNDLADGTFGVRRSAHAGCTPVAAWNASNYNSMLGAPSNICTQDVIAANGTFTLQFTADPDSTQAAGTYRGRATLTATAS